MANINFNVLKIRTSGSEAALQQSEDHRPSAESENQDEQPLDCPGKVSCPEGGAAVAAHLPSHESSSMSSAESAPMEEIDKWEIFRGELSDMFESLEIIPKIRFWETIDRYNPRLSRMNMTQATQRKPHSEEQRAKEAQLAEKLLRPEVDHAAVCDTLYEFIDNTSIGQELQKNKRIWYVVFRVFEAIGWVEKPQNKGSRFRRWANACFEQNITADDFRQVNRHVKKDPIYQWGKSLEMRDADKENYCQLASSLCALFTDSEGEHRPEFMRRTRNGDRMRIRRP